MTDQAALEHTNRADGGTDWQIEQGSNHVIMTVRDADCWYRARVKWDGCIDFARYFNQPFDLAGPNNDHFDQFHICDLDDMIERLTKLRNTARQHFGPDWPAD